MIYVHVPFCRSFCTYCGFYSELTGTKSETLFSEYADALAAEASARREEIEGTLDLNTLYIGGGTPSVLPLSFFHTLGAALPYGPYREFTLEVNPEDIVTGGKEYADALAGLGVTRISMGVQSFDDGILRWMNRRHDSARALRAYELLREAGISNISIDLIFGISGMDDGIWQRTLEAAVDMGGRGAPEHISAYQLSVEDGSALERLKDSGRYADEDEDNCRRQYDLLCRHLADHGYAHYEISNFARPGREAVHNSAYWSRRPYVGLGAGAHSFDGRMRSWNGELGSGRGTLPYSSEKEILGDEDVRTESLMLGLRTAAGVDGRWLRENADAAVIGRLLAEGLLAEVAAGGEARIRIPESSFFISDEIIRILV